jgi:transmembrane sensor
VAEGSVKVTPKEPLVAFASSVGDGETRVSAGHRAILDSAAATTRVSTAAPEAAATWRSGRLQYINEPLKYVVADVSRYSAVEIVVNDAALGELTVTGTVFENDIDGWLESLGEFMPVQVERDGGRRIVLKPRE